MTSYSAFRARRGESRDHSWLGRKTTIGIALCALLLLNSCGTSNTAGDAAVVYATTNVWQDITAQLVCDDSIAVESIIPAGVDPHSYEPSLGSLELDSALLVIANGGGLEAGLHDLLGEASSVHYVLDEDEHGDEASEDENPESVHSESEGHESEDHADEEPDGERDEHDKAAENHESHEHHGEDPHIWLDPVSVAEAVPAIADSLAEAGLDRAVLEECSQQLLADLDDLHNELSEIYGSVDPTQLVVGSDHIAFDHLIDRYGFEFVGAITDSNSTVAETGLGGFEQLKDDLTAANARLLLIEKGSAMDEAEELVREVDGLKIVELFVAGLAPDASYSETQIINAELIVDAIGE